MKTVYIASPYTKGDVAVNVKKSFDVADLLLEKGFAPYPPLYSHFWHLISPKPYGMWMKLDEVWVLKCDYLLRCPGESMGADQEVELARLHAIPVFYSIDDLVLFEKSLDRNHPESLSK